MDGRESRITFSGEERVMGVLLLFVPLTIAAGHANWPVAAQFFLSVAAVIPLAAFVGAATEYLAARLGAKIGGLLNATFGNAPDLLVGIIGVQKGLIPLVKATLIGALMSNSALIMGLCYIAAGLIYRRPRFNREEAGHHSVLMMLTVGAILFPSVGALTLCGPTMCASSASRSTILEVSVSISVVLLMSYCAYIAYGVFGLEALRRSEPEGRDVRFLKERQAEQSDRPCWPIWFSLAVLVAATILLYPVIDILTGSVNGVTRVLGWTQVFVGIIVVANAGNVAEGYAAIKFAIQRESGAENNSGDSGLDLALGIASASSIQIATFVTPIVVLYSLFTHSMTLAFSLIEVAILAMLVLIFTYTAQDGQSNWLEGAQLIALYAMAAAVFFVLPPGVFGQ